MDLQTAGAAIGMLSMIVFWLLLALIPVVLGIMYGLMSRRKKLKSRLARAQMGNAGYGDNTTAPAEQVPPNENNHRQAS